MSGRIIKYLGFVNKIQQGPFGPYAFVNPIVSDGDPWPEGIDCVTISLVPFDKHPAAWQNTEPPKLHQRVVVWDFSKTNKGYRANYADYAETVNPVKTNQAKPISFTLEPIEDGSSIKQSQKPNSSKGFLNRLNPKNWMRPKQNAAMIA